MPPTSTAVALAAALQQAGCAVCRLLAADELRYLDTLLYDQVTNVERRAEIRRARGFCPAHTRAFTLQRGAPMAGAIIARSLIGMLLDAEGLQAGGSRGATLMGLLRGRTGTSEAAARLKPETDCPVCVYLAEQTGRYLDALLTEGGIAPLAEALAASDGVCVPHLARLLSVAPSAGAASHILERQAAVWRDLAGQLDEFVRKHDYRFKDEQVTAEEETAWRRALLLLAGERLGRDELE